MAIDFALAHFVCDPVRESGRMLRRIMAQSHGLYSGWRVGLILVDWKSKAAFDGYCNDPPCICTGKRALTTTSGTSSTSSRTCGRYS